MDEYIDRQAAISILNAKSDMALGTPKQCFAGAAAMLEKLPAADVVEVVRCKDCVCGYKTQNGQILCKFLELGNFIPYVKPNDYCSYGERADEIDFCGKKGE